MLSDLIIEDNRRVIAEAQTGSDLNQLARNIAFRLFELENSPDDIANWMKAQERILTWSKLENEGRGIQLSKEFKEVVLSYSQKYKGNCEALHYLTEEILGKTTQKSE